MNTTETNLVGVARNGSDSRHSKVKERRGEARLFQKRNDEASQTAIHMQAKIISLRQNTQRFNIVDDTMRIVGCTSRNLNA